ncbi:MAG: ATP-binding protein [Coriobacteriales bacterium]|nr:ATP-binding protein [Coriobacteriales bacterium]
MLERDAYEKLLSWRRKNDGKALLVDGARQVGKTYTVEELGRREYPDYVKVDFLRDDQAARTLAGAGSVQEVIESIGVIVGRRLVPGQTLVFFDEVQEVPDIVTYSKYLVQDGRFDVAMSGSLLGIEMAKVRSLPVGYLHTLTMYPLTFLEFCRAREVPESVIQRMEECYHECVPMPEALHGPLIDLFRRYLVVGGMPEAVQAFLNTQGDLGAVRERQEDLVALYEDDIAKHAGRRALQVRAIFDALPGQIGKKNKRFLLNALKQDNRFAEFANDFAWLTDANAALETLCVTEPRPLLERSEQRNRFKLYQSDVGMLMSRYRSSVALAALAGERSVNFGGVYENVVAQELVAAGVPLHYYYHSRKGEVDFVVETDEGVVPIEVKSGKGYKRHVALNNLLASDEYGIDRALVLSEANVQMEERVGGTVTYLPLYLLPFVAAEARGTALPETGLPVVDWEGLIAQ